MVLESKWADAPDEPKVKTKHRSPVKKRAEEAPRLTFSLKNKVKNSDRKADKKPDKKNDKMALLKKKIEEQRQIYEKKQHEKQQKELLESFLNGDDSFQWSDEDEEDKILEKLNKSLKL